MFTRLSSLSSLRPGALAPAREDHRREPEHQFVGHRDDVRNEEVEQEQSRRQHEELRGAGPAHNAGRARRRLNSSRTPGDVSERREQRQV